MFGRLQRPGYSVMQDSGTSGRGQEYHRGDSGPSEGSQCEHQILAASGRRSSCSIAHALPPCPSHCPLQRIHALATFLEVSFRSHSSDSDPSSHSAVASAAWASGCQSWHSNFDSTVLSANFSYPHSGPSLLGTRRCHRHLWQNCMHLYFAFGWEHLEFIYHHGYSRCLQKVWIALCLIFQSRFVAEVIIVQGQLDSGGASRFQGFCDTPTGDPRSCGSFKVLAFHL